MPTFTEPSKSNVTYTKPPKPSPPLYNEPSAKGWFADRWFSGKWFSGKGKGKGKPIYTEPSKGD